MRTPVLCVVTNWVNQVPTMEPKWVNQVPTMEPKCAMLVLNSSAGIGPGTWFASIGTYVSSLQNPEDAKHAAWRGVDGQEW